MPDTRRTADASVPSTQPPPGPKGRGSLELWGPEPGSPFEPPGCTSVVHPLRRRLSPWSTRRSPKPVEKGEGNCGAGDWGGGREGQKNLAVDDYRPEKTSIFLLHEIVLANFIPLFADGRCWFRAAGSLRRRSGMRRRQETDADPETAIGFNVARELSYHRISTSSRASRERCSKPVPEP